VFFEENDFFLVELGFRLKATTASTGQVSAISYRIRVLKAVKKQKKKLEAGGGKSGGKGGHTKHID